MKIESEFQHFAERYNIAVSRLVLLDYEGTLVPGGINPVNRTLDENVRSMVRTLATDRRNEVMVISGEGPNRLGWLWDNTPVILVAEYGAFYKWPGNDWQQSFESSYDWITKLLPALKALTFQYKGSQIERKRYSIAWHYRRADVPQAEVMNILSAIRALPYQDRFLIYVNYQTIELRTPGINKDSFVARWISNRAYDIIMIIGDGATEGLGEIVGDNAFIVNVGSEASAANYNLKSQRDVLPMLDKLLKVNACFDRAMKRVGLRE